MARESLGLFDTSPERVEIRLGLAVVALIFIILLVVLPTQSIHVGPITGFIPTINAAMVVCDMITAAILYAQAAVFRSRALTVLASGYVIGGLLLIPWALTYPGVYAPGGLLGAGLNTTAWIAVTWRLSVPAAIVLYALLKRADEAVGPTAERPPARIVGGVLISVAFVVLVTLVATLGHDYLPPFFVDRTVVIRSMLMGVNVVTISLTVAAIVLLLRQKKSVLDLWLLVSLSAWLAQSLLNSLLQSRDSLGAYVFLGLVLVSELIVMLALIAESNRLYSRLAVSTAARERERDARMMTMDAVAAAIAHEVGQPLTAANLGSSAALDWLTRPEPDTGKAIRSLKDSTESLRRTFDVIKSVRATFAHEMGSFVEFSLNELVRETASLMDREMAAQKISLQLVLEESLPAIRGNRVQLQRVLINLLTNAIESIKPARRRSRDVVIRTTHQDGRSTLVEVEDSGIGIAPEKMPHIFEPFFTTKRSGTGLGLSLSRTIIEEHGGRLWATSGEKGGATFHVQLPLHARVA